MRRLMILSAGVAFGLFFCGCQDSARNGKESVRAPDFVVGRWQSQGDHWNIVISREGTISAVGIPLSKSVLIPNETTEVKMRDDKISTYTLGDCVAEYSEHTRTLRVFIEVEHLKIFFGGNILEGNRQDHFEGVISEDGKTWTTQWIELFDYGEDFPMNPDKIGKPNPLVFTKVDPAEK